MVMFTSSTRSSNGGAGGLDPSGGAVILVAVEVAEVVGMVE